MVSFVIYTYLGDIIANNSSSSFIVIVGIIILKLFYVNCRIRQIIPSMLLRGKIFRKKRDRNIKSRN